MPFWVCHYHLIWTTHQRIPLITPTIEALIFQVAQAKANELECGIHAINTVEDHIHIAVSVPPKHAVAHWVKHLKGAATREINSMFPNLETRFRWEKSYGVLSFGEKQLPFVVDYVLRQKEHHRSGEIIAYMENIEGGDAEG